MTSGKEKALSKKMIGKAAALLMIAAVAWILGQLAIPAILKGLFL